MSSNADRLAEASQCICRLWRAVDLRRYDDVLALLTADCRWHRDGAWQVGGEAILASLERRPADVFVRHMLSNFVIDADGEALSCAYYLAAHGGRGPETGKPRLPETPAAMADMTSRLMPVHGVLRIAEIAMTVTFFRPAPDPGA